MARLFSVLQCLVPRSLSARLIVLTLGSLLVVQAATLATVAHFRQKFTEQVTVEVTATTIRTLRQSLAQIPADQRAEFVRQASRDEWRLWTRTLPPNARLERRGRPADGGRDARTEAQATQRPDDSPPPPNDLRRELRKFVDALNARLDDGTRVGLSRGPVPRMYISLMPDTSDGPPRQEWLVIPLDQLAPPVSTPAILAWLGGMGVLLLMVAAFSWHITRPLTRLAKAADQLAAGKPQRVEPSGPTETRRLAERFNAMLDTLAESETIRRTLLAGLPHDLKGPLARMRLRAEMLDAAEAQEGFKNDIQDMQRMINQFIGFVRGTDPSTYQFAPLDLKTWLDEQIGAWESTGSDVHMVRLPPGPVPVRADRHALARLIDNLVTNALNHAKPPVEVSLATEDNLAVIRIIDHGEGISAERRNEALRPFSRLDTARTLTGSVGLGLALSDAIVKAHQGSLTLGEAPSGGLAIDITLPLAP